MNQTIKQLKQEVKEELISGILPFWLERMQDNVHGGFYGRICGNGNLHTDAEKGAVLNARFFGLSLLLIAFWVNLIICVWQHVPSVN